ncbi:MAG: CvpA family protein [Rikenellaceae bacterium]|nr:CvpA family protein [Rikenellaceae bacterium]
MNITDIILAILLIYSIIHGFKEGIILQLGGLIGIAIGIILAISYSRELGTRIFPDFSFSTELSFIIIILASIGIIGIVGWIFNKIFNFVGLGLINKMGGAIIGFVKTVFLLCIAIIIFDNINSKTDLVENKYFDNSVIYLKLRATSDKIIPSIDTIKETFNNSLR